MTGPTPPRRNGRAWHAAFWPVLVAVSAVTVLGMSALAKSLHRDHVRWLGERADTFEQSLERVVRLRGGDFGPAIVYFGDSTVSEYEPDRTLPRLTQIALRRVYDHEKSFVVSLAGAGSGIDQYAWFADRIAREQPDVVIWQLSFFQFTDRWTQKNGAPELVGYVDAGRLPEILALPYARLRLTLADILLHQAIVKSGLHDAHRSLRKRQLRFAHVRDVLEEALNPNRGRSPEKRAATLRGRGYQRRHIDPERRDRYSRHGEIVHFEDTLPGLEQSDPRLGLLRSGIGALRARGTEVLVYLNPANLDNLRRVGVFDEAGIARTVAAVREAAESSGAHFLDLHDMLGDDEFVDPPGHFVVDDYDTVPRRIAAKVAAATSDVLAARKAAALGGPGGHE